MTVQHGKKAKYEAVAVRYVHDVLTGEFLNVGVLVMSPRENFLGCKFLSQWGRVTDAFCSADRVQLARVATAIHARCSTWKKQGEHTDDMHREKDLKAFLSALAPDQDGAIQFSPITYGLTADLEQATRQMFVAYVSRHSPEPEERASRSDDEVLQKVVDLLPRKELMEKLQPRELRGRHLDVLFDMSWLNGVTNVAKTVSFDLKQPRDITEKSATWLGKIRGIEPSKQQALVSLIVGLPPAENHAQLQAAEEGIALLREHLLGEADVYTEDQTDTLFAKIERDIANHPQQAGAPPDAE